MDTQQAYDQWAIQYDSNVNKTRDLEAQVLRTTLSGISFNNCLEIGCGTGKNTVWLMKTASHITAVDLSEEMLAKAKAKVSDAKVSFTQADITKDWSFTNKQYDLVSYSLILEHIDDLNHIFKQTFNILQPDGHVYIGELHPFKQYSGSKARFTTKEGEQLVQCFDHHISDLLSAAKKNGLTLIDINEYFDDDDRKEIPRILMLLFKK